MTRPDPPERSCLGSCCSFIFTSGLTALILWLSLRTTNPTCSIERFDAFALNKSSNSISNHYDLKLNNKNREKGIYYDALNLTFYYKPNLTSYPIGNPTYPAFYQGHYKKAHRIGNLDPTPGVNWENATLGNGTTGFRVELVTAVRFKILFWKTKRHRLVVGADLEVNDQGSLVKRKKNKGIKMTSEAHMNKGIKGWFHMVGVFGMFVFIHFC